MQETVSVNLSPLAEEPGHSAVGVRPFAAKVARWNAELPRLRAVLSSIYSTGFDKTRAVAEVEEALEHIVETRAMLTEATGEAASSRITDILGALNGLARELGALRTRADSDDAASRNVRRVRQPFPGSRP